MFATQDLLEETEGLRKFALKLTKNVYDAEDLVQSTVLRALEKKELFQSGTNLFSWTSKIMYNMFVSNYRRKTKYETETLLISKSTNQEKYSSVILRISKITNQ